MTWASNLSGPIDRMAATWESEYKFHRCGSLAAGSANLYSVALAINAQGGDGSKLLEVSAQWELDFQQDQDCVDSRGRFELYHQSDRRSQSRVANVSYRRIAP